jgi:hypothetical protein
VDSMENRMNVRCILILSPNLRLGVPSGPSSSGIPTVVYTFLISPRAVDTEARGAKRCDHW